MTKKVRATLDLDKLGMTIEQWAEFARGQYWEEVVELTYSNHLRDMTEGWTKISSVKEWNSDLGPFKPGTYAFVFDDDGKVAHPLQRNRTILFGETTRSAYLRIHHHHGALRNKSTNTRESWKKRIPIINKIFDCDIQNQLDKVIIFFRPHDHTDENFQYDTNHSRCMETQAQAQYYAMFGQFTPGNTRDMPHDWMIKESRVLLEAKGYKTIEPKKHWLEDLLNQ